MNRILFLTFIFLSCSNVDCNELVYQNGVTTLGSKLFDGDCESNFNNGKLSSIQSYFQGKDNGAWIFYYQNGLKKTEAFFDKGKRIGEWKYYHENGKLFKVQRYNKQGQKEGVWETFNENGELIRTDTISN